MSRVVRIDRLFFVVAIIITIASRPAVAQRRSPRRLIDAAGFELTALEDSSAYLLYRYRITNSASSRGGIGWMTLDLLAAPGTERFRLPFTGDVGHGGGDAGDHVPFGAIAPAGWRMLVIYYGGLDWYAAESWVPVGDSGSLPQSSDSAAPGGEKAGFGIRSPYLPGIRRFSAKPTYQSCCMPANSRGESPSPLDFPDSGFTVAPTIRPQDVSIDVLRADLDQICGPLRWIADGDVCGALHAKLATSTPDWHGFLDVLEAQHGTGKPVNDNAYWLLKVNAAYLLARN